MGIERKFNQYDQEQIIDNFDKLIKIGDKFIQVRLIKTKKYKERFNEDGRFTAPMPRAKFVKPGAEFYYLVSKKDVIELKQLREQNGKSIHKN